jgi:hypothetical protein
VQTEPSPTQNPNIFPISGAKSLILFRKHPESKPELLFLKNSDLKTDLMVINLKKQMSLIQNQFPSGFNC